MKKLYIHIFAIFICSCSMNVKNDENFGHFQMVKMSIPNIRLEELMNKELISKEEIVGIVEKYTKMDESADPESPPGGHYFLCGGVWVDGRNNLDNVSLFRFVGVIEKWIPINGKPTKFLHFKVVE